LTVEKLVDALVLSGNRSASKDFTSNRLSRLPMRFGLAIATAELWGLAEGLWA